MFIEASAAQTQLIYHLNGKIVGKRGERAS